MLPVYQHSRVILQCHFAHTMIALQAPSQVFVHLVNSPLASTTLATCPSHHDKANIFLQQSGNDNKFGRT